MPEIPQHDEEDVAKKDNKKTEGVKPEDSKNPETNDGESKRTPEEEAKAKEERDAKHEEQKQRDEKEKGEHSTEEDDAEKKLDDAIFKEKYESMRDNLQGDAKEIFSAVEGKLTEQEKIDIARGIDSFNEGWDREWAKATGDTGGKTQAEKMRESANRRDQTNAITLQNSIDEIIRETQGLAKDNPTTNVGKLAKEVNEKVNAALGKKESTAGDKALGKLGAAIEQHILDERAKDPSKTFKPKEKQRNYVVDKSDDEYKEKVDSYAAQNLLNEVSEAKSRGIVVTIKNAEGKELTIAEDIAKELAVMVDIKTEGNAAKLTSEQIQKGMTPETAFVKESSGVHTFIEGATNVREGIEKLEKIVDKDIKKRKLKS